MDSSLVIRSTDRIIRTMARGRPGAARAIETQLAASQSVTAADDGPPPAPVHDDGRDALPAQLGPHDIGIGIDAQAREVIYREAASGQADEQTPEEAMRKLRAYSRTAEPGETDGHAVEKTA